jgi:transketolase
MIVTEISISDSESFARDIRMQSIRMIHRAKASHIGSCLSVIDILACLYGSWLNVNPERPEDPLRDIFVLSKGHAAAAIYATLALRGFFPLAELEGYCRNGAILSGHVTHLNVPGVEISTGSLGHGLSFALGFALAAKRAHISKRVVAVLSDGECNEGSVWEAALLAPQLKIGRLVTMIDYNKIQSLGRVSDVIDLAPLGRKFESFGWRVTEIDGHSHREIFDALLFADQPSDQPCAIVCNTIKGKGVSFMEDKLLWHYRSPDDSELQRALAELA